MINHFASLLINLNLVTPEATRENYLLASEEGTAVVSDIDEYIIALDNYYSAIAYNKQISPLVYRDYARLSLPEELEAVYNILFPATASKFYKQFLLYSYLRIVGATDRAADIKIYDERITYDLNKLDNYFKAARTFEQSSTATDFNLFVTGSLTNTANTLKENATFVIAQISNTRSVLVFDVNSLSYRKTGRAASKSATGMDIELVVPEGSDSSAPVNIEGTDLFFSIAGPFQCTGTNCGFASTSNRQWVFKAEAPFVFDFIKLTNELELNQEKITTMFNWNKDQCNVSYENMWDMHYNAVYRLAGLLLGYVERVNILWQHYLT